MQSLFILGRQPSLGLSELESLYGADKLTPIGGQAALLDVEPKDVDFRRIGGSIKHTKVLSELPFIDFNKAVDFINKEIPKHLEYIPEGKIKFGLSVYGLRVKVNDINKAALRMKRTIKGKGRSIRVVPNNELSLNSAQVLHNQLTSQVGMELVLVASGPKLLICQTVSVQDIDAYAARDQQRPNRDAKVGMLPPKLAQIIVNLAVGDADPSKGQVVLDPFCGTGVVLQEASLMGFDVAGSDLEARMVEYTDKNLMWLLDKYGSPVVRPETEKDNSNWRYFKLQKGDATALEWSPMPNFIAAETYLGRPFSSKPDNVVLQEVMQDVNLIHKRFLQNIARQTEAGFRMCIAVPAWKDSYGFKHLKMLDNLEDLGYNRMKFVHVDDIDLIYHREGQIVGRELVVLVRK